MTHFFQIAQIAQGRSLEYTLSYYIATHQPISYYVLIGSIKYDFYTLFCLFVFPVYFLLHVLSLKAFFFNEIADIVATILKSNLTSTFLGYQFRPNSF